MPSLERLTTASIAVGEAWSGSPIGYHARVYYVDFAPPPAGAHFSSEWGFSEALSNYTAGDWREYTYRDVVDHIRRLAGSPDLTNVKAASLRARETLNDGKADAASLLTAALAMHDDPLLAEVKTDAAKVLAGNGAAVPAGDSSVRPGHVARHASDDRGVSCRSRISPFRLRLLALKAPFDACGELAVLAQRGATHLNRVSSGRRAPAIPSGTAVVIGHGRSLAWRELKDFVHERLDLPWDEFNRVPVAGMTNIARLSEMLDNAVIALLVLTAEDEMADGSVPARQNVIHEVGLFQGRLGFTRAIVLLEEGCAEFSNIEGLGQIRFPAGKIGATFEEVRRVMEREGLARPVTKPLLCLTRRVGHSAARPVSRIPEPRACSSSIKAACWSAMLGLLLSENTAVFCAGPWLSRSSVRSARVAPGRSRSDRAIASWDEREREGVLPRALTRHVHGRDQDGVPTWREAT